MSIRVPIDPEVSIDFCRRHHIKKLSIFGSAIRNDFGPHSDIDVLVEFDPQHIPGFAFTDMQDELTEILGRRVDLNTPAFLSPHIRDRVEQEALMLHAEA